jgi:hypothetical protein
VVQGEDDRLRVKEEISPYELRLSVESYIPQFLRQLYLLYFTRRNVN